MSAQNWRNAYAIVRRHEGGNVDDPHDPGGRTSRGVTQRVYDAFLFPAASRDVWKASEQEIEAIYRRQYWDAVHGDELPPGVDLAVYDAAVNSGPSQAVKWLQRALGVGADGTLGHLTFEAIDRRDDMPDLVSAICARRLEFLRRLRTWPRFGKGWASRVKQIEAAGRAWAGDAATHAVVPFVDAPQPKARREDVAKPVVAPEAAAVSGGTAFAIAGQIREVTAEVPDMLRDALPAIQYVLLALGAVAAMLAIWGIVTRMRNAQAGEG